MPSDDGRFASHGLIHHRRQGRLGVLQLNFAHDLIPYDYSSHIYHDGTGGIKIGEVVAARAARSGKYARRGEPSVTGSITSYAGKADARPADDAADWIEHDGPRESVD